MNKLLNKIIDCCWAIVNAIIYLTKKLIKFLKGEQLLISYEDHSSNNSYYVYAKPVNQSFFAINKILQLSNDIGSDIDDCNRLKLNDNIVSIDQATCIINNFCNLYSDLKYIIFEIEEI